METPEKLEQSHGLVAILDALGAASYSDIEITKFLDARSSVLELFEAKTAESKVIAKESLSTFTFNDTVLISCRLGYEASLKEVKSFFVLLRKLIIDSMVNGILFRGQ